MQVLEKRYIGGEKKGKRNHSNMVTAFNVFCGAYILFPMNYLQCSGQKKVPPVRQRGLLKQQWTPENYSSYSFENTLPTCPKSKTPESARTPPMQLLAPEYLIVSIRASVPPCVPSLRVAVGEPSAMADQYERQLLGIILQDDDPVFRSNGYSGSAKDMSRSEVFPLENCIILRLC